MGRLCRHPNSTTLPASASVAPIARPPLTPAPANAATIANLAPIAALQLNIGGDFGGNTSTFTSGAGAIVYAASNPLTPASTEPGYTDFDDGTAENGNVIFGPMPDVANQLSTQSFLATTAAAPAVTRIVPPGKAGRRTRTLPQRGT